MSESSAGTFGGSGPENARSDLATPETFTTTVSFGQFMRIAIPMLVITFLVSAFIFAVVLNAVGVPGGLLAGAVAAVPFCALMVLGKKRQFDQRWGKQTVTFSPAGVVMDDRDTRVELPWTHVRSVGDVEQMGVLRTRTSSDLSRMGAGMIRGVADATTGAPEHGLVGAGVLTAKPEAPALVKKQVQQFLNGGPDDPEIGQRPMGIPLLRFNRNWQNGRIGEWVRAYRPDLLD